MKNGVLILVLMANSIKTDRQNNSLSDFNLFLLPMNLKTILIEFSKDS